MDGIWPHSSESTKQVLAFQPPVWGNLQPGLPPVCNHSSFYLNMDWRCVEHETSFLVQIKYCDWFVWCVVTAVALLVLLTEIQYLQQLLCYFHRMFYLCNFHRMFSVIQFTTLIWDTTVCVWQTVNYLLIFQELQSSSKTSNLN